jgi:hypothetical protein
MTANGLPVQGVKRSANRGETLAQLMPSTAPSADPWSRSNRRPAFRVARGDTAQRSLTNALADVEDHCDSAPLERTSQTRAGRPSTSSPKAGWKIASLLTRAPPNDPPARSWCAAFNQVPGAGATDAASVHRWLTVLA